MASLTLIGIKELTHVKSVLFYYNNKLNGINTKFYCIFLLEGDGTKVESNKGIKIACFLSFSPSFFISSPNKNLILLNLRL